MRPNCPYCEPENEAPGSRTKVHRLGFFYRKSDGKRVRRFRCLQCKKHFSFATFNPCFKQKKRRLNHVIGEYLVSGVSQRRCAKLLRVSRLTVERKFLFLAEQAFIALDHYNQNHRLAHIVEFDDLETFEHSKCKPLSVTLAVEYKSRRILGFQVSQMPAKGKLALLARKKYGRRADQRVLGRRRLFKKIRPLLSPQALIKSDESPHYPYDVRKFFPHATHERHKGQRGSIVGQGELKKVRFDPLFSLNHTFAMLRANINRLFRKTWCTTKKPERLAAHIAIYAAYHNFSLLSGP